MLISLLAGNAAVNNPAALLNANPPGVMKLFTGSAPATPETADSGTLLCTWTFTNPAFASAASAVATANAIAAATAVATGTAGYMRAYDGSGTCVAQMTVGTSGADMIFGTLAIASGDVMTITTLTWTQLQST